MKKTFIILFLCSCLGAWAQTTTTLRVFNIHDSSAVQKALVEISFNALSLKKISIITDTNGQATFTIPTNMGYRLLVYKEGFKPIITAMDKEAISIDVYLKTLVYDGEEVTVTATRPGTMSATTYTQLSAKELNHRNFGQDIPVLLQTTPSVVTTSDAGTGIGYTGMRIRGIDPTRINVTINGVPLNDAESQGVFWVNMPDFASGVENIQVQRGVGTSTNGSGAFGAAINIKTDKFSEIPYANVSFSAGSFNTTRESLKFGTGRLNNNWYVEGRWSNIRSNGYIDRAFSRLQAWYFTTGRKTQKSLFQVNVFSGGEKTYQAWNGVPMAKYLNDSAGVDSFINYMGYDSSKASQLRLSDPNTYNYYTYYNETDNYRQSHIQVVYNRILKRNRTFNMVLHGTLGKGYYENKEYNTPLSNFTDTPVVLNNTNYYTADLIHQRWLQNKFAGIVLSYLATGVRTDQTIGGALNAYTGSHFGHVLWHEYMPPDAKGFDYYNNQSLKTDAMAYWKVQHKFTKNLSAYTDVQLRHVFYEWFGPLENGESNNQNTTFLFFNPKAGLQYQFKPNQRAYITYGRASREPVRDDFVNSTTGSRPKPEFMNNVEAAFNTSKGDWKFTVTGYYMGYKDQLALTGKINDVGGYTRINIPKSHRAGIELEGNVNIASWLNWNFNVSVSRNRVKAFTEYVDDYTLGGQKAYYWKNTTLALSPSKIIGSQFSVTPSKVFDILFITKFVSRQYLDNTETISRSLEPYVINDVIFQFKPRIKRLKVSTLGLMINNLGNTQYANNGYSYSGLINNRRKDFSFVYPQAGTHFLARMDVRF